jgi:osmotically-inducible protein OsmY
MQTIQHKSNTVARDANATQNINVGNVPVSNVVVADVTNNESSSSLELTLENKDLNKINEEYKKTIVEQLGNREGAVGIAYYINGKLYSIDVYNNHQLFTDLFDKLLDAAIAEAISVKSNGQESVQGDIQLVKDLLKADAKVYVEENVNKITQAITSENNVNKDMWIFSTVDLEEKTWLHRNWIIK